MVQNTPRHGMRVWVQFLLHIESSTGYQSIHGNIYSGTGCSRVGLGWGVAQPGWPGQAFGGLWLHMYNSFNLESIYSINNEALPNGLSTGPVSRQIVQPGGEERSSSLLG